MKYYKNLMLLTLLTFFVIGLKGQTINKIDSNSLTFIGRADLQTITNKTKDNTDGNIGMGLKLHRIYKKPKFFKDLSILASINVSSTSDTIIASSASSLRSFGIDLLNPVSSSQSARFESVAFLNLYDSDKSFVRFIGRYVEGAMLEFYGSNKVWQLDDQKNDVSLWLLRVGLFHEFLENEVSVSRSTSIRLGLTYTYRGVFGDVRLNNSDELERYLGTKRSTYSSFDIKFTLRVKDIEASFVLPIISGRKGEVSGLTNNQMYTAIQFVGGFPIK